MRVIKMDDLSAEQLEQAAQILHESLPIGWPTLEEAREEIRERLIPENMLLAAVENTQVLGWAGILAPTYQGRVFELHPLCVREESRRRGVGATLVRALEARAKEQGGLTLWLGADDELAGGETSLANVDLFDNLPGKLAAFKAGRHQSAFYLKLGFQVIGVMPNANGKGKPDIYMGKPLA